MPITCKDPKTIQLALKAHVSEILDLGEILISYGEFLENNKPLAPASYVFEWWAAELIKAGGDPVGRESINGERPLPLQRIHYPPSSCSTFLWHDLTLEDYEQLREVVSSQSSLSMNQKAYSAGSPVGSQSL